MTLNALLEELAMLPSSAQSAPVIVNGGDFDNERILAVRYESGQVIIEVEGGEEDDND